MASSDVTDGSDQEPPRRRVWIVAASVAAMTTLAGAALWTAVGEGDEGTTASISSQPATPQEPGDERSESLETRLVDETLGVYPGFGDESTLRELETTLGTKLGAVVQFGDRRWPDAMVFSMQGALAQLAPWIEEREPIYSLAVPLAFGSSDATSREGRAKVVEHLAATAAGAHDEQYRLVASRLIEAGVSDAVLRLGHEPDGDWFPWSAQPSCEAYIEAFRHVASLFRAESASFRIEWTVTDRWFDQYGVCAYPGDDVVDIIGLDVFDRGGPMSAVDSSGWIDPQATWEEEFRPLMENHLAFAVERNKPVSYPEWALVLDFGVGAVGGDNPFFIEAMADWFDSLPARGAGSLVYQAYFLEVAHDVRSAPNSWETFQERFGVP